MNWEGSVLTGVSGAQLISRMAERAKTQSLRRSNEATGLAFRNYSPWMSHANKRTSWPYLHLDTTAPTIPNDVRLKQLSEAFNENGPLRAIDPSNCDREINYDNPGATGEFRIKIAGYLSDIQTLSPDYAVRIQSLVQEVIPLRKISNDMPTRFDGEGMTTQCYRGGVFLTLAYRSDHHYCEDLLNLIHEVGHQAFNLILCSDQIVSGDIYIPAYSPVRKTMRPGILAAHALIAVAYMIELMARAPDIFMEISNPEWVKPRFRSLLEDLDYGLSSVRSLQLTPVGKALVAEIESLGRFARSEAYEHYG